MKVGQLGHEPVLKWDAGASGGGLAHYFMTLALGPDL